MNINFALIKFCKQKSACFVSQRKYLNERGFILTPANNGWQFISIIIFVKNVFIPDFSSLAKFF